MIYLIQGAVDNVQIVSRLDFDQKDFSAPKYWPREFRKKINEQKIPIEFDARKNGHNVKVFPLFMTKENVLIVGLSGESVR